MADVSPEAGPQITSATEPPGSFGPTEVAATILTLDPGLYLLTVTGSPVSASIRDGLQFPRVQVFVLPASPPGAIAIGHSRGDNVWLGRDGGIVPVRCAAAGGQIAVATCGERDQVAKLPTLSLRRLADVASEGPVWIGWEAEEASDKPASHEREVPIQVRFHVERLGDRVHRGPGWVGTRGGKLRLEAFDIAPLEQIAPSDIEYQGVHPGGVLTPWIKGPAPCGTRGQGLPLVGFAIRLAPALRHRFDLLYSGAFCNSGTIGPQRDGQLCRPSVPDDPIEAIDIHIIERLAG